MRQGNVFTPVCHSVHKGGVYPTMHLGRHPLARPPPPGQTPSPQADPPGQTPLGRQTPRQTPPGQTPPSRKTPPDRYTPWADTPHPPPAPSRWLLQWTVRILLECILVLIAIKSIRSMWSVYPSTLSYLWLVQNACVAWMHEIALFFMKQKSLRNPCIKVTVSSHGMFDIGALTVNEPHTRLIVPVRGADQS